MQIKNLFKMSQEKTTPKFYTIPIYDLPFFSDIKHRQAAIPKYLCLNKCYYLTAFEHDSLHNFYSVCHLTISNFLIIGWESQLLETGFLAAFLCPLLSLKQVPARSPPSFIVILAFRWIIFRIMLGAVRRTS